MNAPLNNAPPDEAAGLEELLRAALRGPSAATARAAVAGAVAALRTAVDPVLGDPAAAPDPAVRRAADVLAGLVSGPVESAAAPLDPVAALATAFAADPDVAVWIGATAVLHGDPGESWLRLWLSFLRLPPDLAEHWRARARPLAAGERPSQWREVAGADAVLVEPAFGVAGLRESKDPAGSPDVPALPGRCAELGRLAGTVLTMAGLDPALHHALESRQSRNVHSLGEPAHLADLHRDLLRRITYLAAAEAGSPAALRELTMVDEALCSVVHVPPAHPDSWWGALGRRSRAVLSAAAADLRTRGADVEVRVVPPGDYAAQERWIGRNNVACSVPGRPAGQILACLRAYLRLGADEYPARVVYVRDDG
ncbi:hypothetical protein [Pseudonocardia sp.]|uniref:hypothetical protein n=1 Tax=Pseudonocardia sp. TaxID=60912 RepID=UPI003D0F2A41